MLGTNEVYKPDFTTPADMLKVHEVFPTVQGEGPFAGYPAFFIRLSHCNLRCYFCDTDFSHETKMSADQILKMADDWRADRGGAKLVVITGGEPLAQNLGPLLEYLTKSGFHVQIETAGSLPLYHEGSPMPLISLSSDPHPGHVSIVCSPKTPKVDRSLIPLISCYKYIVGYDDDLDPDDGLPITSTQRKGDKARIYRPTTTYLMRGQRMTRSFSRQIYIQPRDDGDDTKNKVNLLRAVGVVLDHGYRLSIQTHKLLGLP